MNRREFVKLAGLTPLLGCNFMRRADRLFLPDGENRPDNILILVFDALSASHLSLNGYPRQTAPNLTRLADLATVYYSHFSAANFTTPGTASMLTGVHPWSHRALQLFGIMLEPYIQRNLFALAGKEYYRLSYSHNPLATLLLYQMRDHLDEFMFTRKLALADLQYSDRVFPGDYNTAFWGEELALRGVNTYPSSFFLAPLYRMFQNFQVRSNNLEYKQDFPLGVSDNDGFIFYILEDGINWCIDQLGELPKPFLAYMHFLPPHDPYFSRNEFIGIFDDKYKPPAKPRHRFSVAGYNKKRLNELRQKYDEYIAYTDSEFGRLFDHLERTGLLESTILVLTSDHGEMFERGIWGHVTRTVYDPVLRVPLLLRLPGQTNRIDIHTPTSSVDLVPTLLHLMGKPVPDWCEGQVLPPFAADSSGPDQEIFSVEAKLNPRYGPLATGTFALIKGHQKLIHYRGYEDFSDENDELYNLSRDADELEDLVDTQKDLAKDMRQILERKLAEVNQGLSTG